MDVEIICPGCKQVIDVDSEAQGQAFDCPTCCSSMKVPKLPVFPQSLYSALFCHPLKVCPFELECAPTSAGKEYDPDWRHHGFSSIRWFQPVYVVRRKMIKVKTHPLPEISRRDCVNLYSIPEDVICQYSRYLGTRSRKFEKAFFTITNGSTRILAEGTLDFVMLFMKEFEGFHIYMP